MELEQWPGLVYEPQEDSYMFLKILKNYCKPGLKVLDMGCGSGILGISAALQGCNVTSADLNPLALKLTRKNAEKNNVKIKTVYTDLFQNVNEEYDLIIFNPPYLPSGEVDNIQWTGGLKGNETTIKFIKQAKNHLTPKGTILLMISSRSKPEEVFQELRKQKLQWKEINSEKYFFEKITLLEIKKPT